MIMLSGVQTGKRIPHDEYNVRGIAHALALGGLKKTKCGMGNLD